MTTETTKKTQVGKTGTKPKYIFVIPKLNK